jgi:hypothetical protein
LPNILANGKEASAYGATLAATWQPAARWRVKADYSWFKVTAHPDAGSLDQSARRVEGDGPRHEANVQPTSISPAVYRCSWRPDTSMSCRVRAFQPARHSMQILSGGWQIGGKLR